MVTGFDLCPEMSPRKESKHALPQPNYLRQSIWSRDRSGQSSKSQKAALAAQVVLGEATLDDLARAQVCAMFGVSLGYLNKALALSQATREAVSAGKVTLQDIPVIPTDRVLHKVTHDAGVARVWEMLEPMI